MDGSRRVTVVSMALEWNSVTLGWAALHPCRCPCPVPVPWRELPTEEPGRAICHPRLSSLLSLCTCLIKDLPGVSRGQRMGCREGLNCLGGGALGCPALEGCFLEMQTWEPVGPRVPASIPDLVRVLAGMLSPLHLMGCVQTCLRMCATLWPLPFGPDGTCCFSGPGGTHETSSLTPLLNLLHQRPEVLAARLPHPVPGQVVFHTPTQLCQA